MSNYKKVPKNLDYLKKAKTGSLEKVDLMNPEELGDIKYELTSPEELFGKEAMDSLAKAQELPSPEELFGKGSLDSELPPIEDLLGKEALSSVIGNDDVLLPPERLFKEETETKKNKKADSSKK